ncbi:uncharacterized protein [Garra rufa]|uniref:uncharacterized protein n=1 Tax=Garra rufa TaxID=137080 RepID=UPI003CCEE51F
MGLSTIMPTWGPTTLTSSSFSSITCKMLCQGSRMSIPSMLLFGTMCGGMPGVFSPVAWPEKMWPLMWMKSCGLTQYGDMMLWLSKIVSSCLYKEVGDKVVIPFGGEKLDAYDELRWSHNKKRVYYKRGSAIKESELNVDQHGSLVLENVQKDKSGEYTGVAYNEEGGLLKKTDQQLCVQEPVPEPTVMFEAVENEVNLICSAVHNESTVVWIKNGMNANVTGAVLHINSSELKSGDTFSCTVSNMINQKSAKEVKLVWSDTGLHATIDNDDREKEVNSNSGNTTANDEATQTFLGLDFWWTLVILTGGGCFLLILFIIGLVCVWYCGQKKRKAKKEEEYRLTALMPDHTNQPDDQYMQQTTSQRASKSQRPLPPLPIPQGPPYFGPV